MKTAAVYKHFGSQHAIARALQCSQPSVQKWGLYPPPLRQLQIERETQGALKAEPDALQQMIDRVSKRPTRQRSKVRPRNERVTERRRASA